MKINLMKYFLQLIFSSTNENITVRIIVCTIPRASARRSHLRSWFNNVSQLFNFSAPSYCTFYSTSASQKQQTHQRQLSRQMSCDSSFLFHSQCFRLRFRTPTPLQSPPLILLHIRGSLEYNNYFRITLPSRLQTCSSLPFLTHILLLLDIRMRR